MARPKSKKRAPKQIKNRKRRLFLPWPLLIFLFICSCVFLIAKTFNVGADDIFVTAKVSGPLVTSPAVITSPTDGTHFTSIPISVSGTCPTNAAYVEIFRNNLMSGTALCDINSNFQLSISLFPGRNDLAAHVFNLTDDEGPVSATVTVFYDVPNPPSSATTPAGSSGKPSASNPFTLQTAFVYKGYLVGQEVDWPLQISGGTAPYAVSVDWGDGTNDVISRGAAGSFDIKHTYSESGGYKGSYTIKVKASDGTGNSAFIQFFVIVKNHAGIGTAFTKSPPSLNNRNWLWAVWIGYLLVLLLAISYWLGEREELITLRRRGLLKHR
jgi:hypothetical protein